MSNITGYKLSVTVGGKTSTLELDEQLPGSLLLSHTAIKMYKSIVANNVEYKDEELGAALKIDSSALEETVRQVLLSWVWDDDVGGPRVVTGKKIMNVRQTEPVRKFLMSSRDEETYEKYVTVVVELETITAN